VIRNQSPTTLKNCPINLEPSKKGLTNQNSIQKEIKHRRGMLAIIRSRIFAVQKYRDLDTQHFACCFVWV